MKTGEIYVQTRTVEELRYVPENMVVLNKVENGEVHFSRLKPLAYCNNTGVLLESDFEHLFQFYF